MRRAVFVLFALFAFVVALPAQNIKQVLAAGLSPSGPALFEVDATGQLLSTGFGLQFATGGSSLQQVLVMGVDSTGAFHPLKVNSDGSLAGSSGSGGPIYTPAEYSNGTCTTAATIAPANGNHQNVTLTAGDTCALTFTQPASGTMTITLKVIQSSSASYNGAISGCKWPGGSVPTITQTSGAIDFLTAYLDGTNAYCVASQNFE